MLVEMELARIIIQETSEQQIIVLREKGGERAFPISIGIGEALAINRRVNGLSMPRPMTHDLVLNVIREMGGELERVVINDLREHTFIANLEIRREGEIIEVDCRPSDAIAVGAAQETPIFVAEHVLEQVC
ncbi:MAG: bifunctional nuclease family protein [Sedimentisphaerales bacterium]|nr:bifunctional nuclease family protein [Sedimentisphaerales bacterium]